jgi:hypothetical protein
MPTLSAEENIKRMCFLKTSPLLKEFERIFSDIFGLKPVIGCTGIRTPACLKWVRLQLK